jgi:hypothetical protein
MLMILSVMYLYLQQNYPAGGTEAFGGKRAQELLRLPQIPQGLTCDRTQTSAVRRRWTTAWVTSWQTIELGGGTEQSADECCCRHMWQATHVQNITWDDLVTESLKYPGGCRQDKGWHPGASNGTPWPISHRAEDGAVCVCLRLWSPNKHELWRLRTRKWAV